MIYYRILFDGEYSVSLMVYDEIKMTIYKLKLTQREFMDWSYDKKELRGVQDDLFSDY